MSICPSYSNHLTLRLQIHNKPSKQVGNESHFQAHVIVKMFLQSMKLLYLSKGSLILFLVCSICSPFPANCMGFPLYSVHTKKWPQFSYECSPLETTLPKEAAILSSNFMFTPFPCLHAFYMCIYMLDLMSVPCIAEISSM